MHCCDAQCTFNDGGPVQGLLRHRGVLYKWSWWDRTVWRHGAATALICPLAGLGVAGGKIGRSCVAVRCEPLISAIGVLWPGGKEVGYPRAPGGDGMAQERAAWHGRMGTYLSPLAGSKYCKSAATGDREGCLLRRNPKPCGTQYGQTRSEMGMKHWP